MTPTPTYPSGPSRDGTKQRHALRFALLPALLSIAACASGTDRIPVSASAAPGPQIMSAYDVGVIFGDVCLTRGANFENAKEGLAGFPFVQSPSSGTYFHKTANLSVNINAERCSVVYATNAPAQETVTGLAQGTASLGIGPLPKGITVTSSKAADGLLYFNLRAPAPLSFP